MVKLTVKSSEEVGVKVEIEKIQQHDFLDIYRIQNGSLLYVKKYERDPKYIGHFYGELFNKSSKIVRGCKGLRVLKVDYTYYNYSSGSNETIPFGSFFLDGSAIILANKENFVFEIKSNEGFGGNLREMQEALSKANEIIKSYI